MSNPNDHRNVPRRAIESLGNGNALIVGIFRAVMVTLVTAAVIGAFTGNRELGEIQRRIEGLQHSTDQFARSQHARDQRQDNRIAYNREVIDRYLFGGGSIKP